MRLAEREAGLLKLVGQYRDEACRRQLEEARAQAARLLQQTFARERAHLHAQITAERERARERIEAVLADRETRTRRSGERASAELLAAAWPRLEAALVERWQSVGGRRGWAEHHLRLAQQRLPPAQHDGHWVVRHAPEWTEAERGALSACLALGLEHQPRFIADGELVAGLTIACCGAVLDASLAGLLRDRNALEARLLALIDASQDTHQAGPTGGAQP